MFMLQMLCYCWAMSFSLAVFAGSDAGILNGASLGFILLLAKYLINKSICRQYIRMTMTRMAVDMLKQYRNNTDNGKCEIVEISDRYE